MNLHSLEDLITETVLEDVPAHRTSDTTLLRKEAHAVAADLAKEGQVLGRAGAALKGVVERGRRALFGMRTPAIEKALERRTLAELQREIASEKALQEFYKRYGPSALLRRTRPTAAVPGAPTPGVLGQVGPLGAGLALGAGTGALGAALLGRGRQPRVSVREVAA